ncbi:MAG: chromosome segregation protein SMC [Candidatus Altiarchaeales archaeon]|nr:chromosome segregation protein SMC [Candidatus Altiarchaeales archaeon]MBD3416850.1 chromosome segregation protein SMC [Candidatus Altiarchaeales archaeon]
MRLTRLELKGFKSFRDKTVLEFPDKFTGVVGPNGSGKSNITEAICFVLGKSRGLRAANLQELIFNGGVGGQPATKAVVSLTLKDDEGRKHKITRIVDRDGTSLYKLNDKRTTRQRIVELVGDSEYNIILQDDVTKVVEMRPKDRRKIIDDLCGIGVYDEKRDKALRELEKVEERIGQTHLILGEKQGYMRELKKERDEAIKYVDIRDELRSCKATLLDKEIQSLERRDEKIDELTGEMTRGREENLKRISDIKSEIQSKNQRLREINSEVLRLEEEKRGTKITETRGEILRHEDRMSILAEQLGSLESEEKEKKERVSLLAEEERKVREQMESVEKRTASLGKELESEAGKSADPAVESELDEAKNRVYEARSRIKALTELNVRKSEEKKTLEMERESLESKLKNWSMEEQGKIKDVAKLKRDYDKALQDFKGFEEEYSRANREITGLQARLEEQRILLGKKESELQTIMRASGGLQKAARAVVGLKKVIPGIQGPVMQLGEVANPEYNLPLQVAAGARMHHVVVSKVDDAAKCIDYLRKKEIGRCTFLPLDKIGFKPAGKPPAGSLGFARDYIKSSAKFKKVFEYVFGDTILVKDIAAAKKIGVGSWRMVTLDGDLLELSGAMTGGHTPERFEITFSNIEELEKEIGALDSGIGSLQAEYDEKSRVRSRLDQTLAKLRENLRQSKEALDNTTFDKNILSERRGNLREKLDGIVGSIESLSGQISENSMEVKKLEKSVVHDEKALAGLLEKRGKGETTKLDSLKDDLRDLEVEKTKLNEKKTFILQQMGELKSRVDQVRSARQEVKSEMGSLETKVKDLHKGLESLEKAHQSVGGEIEELVKERDSAEEELTALSSRIGEIEHGMEGVSQKLNEFIIEKTRIQTRLEDLKREFGKYEGVELLDKSVKELSERAEKLEADLVAFGSVNMRSIETYDVIKREFDDIMGKLDTLKSERQSIFDFMDKIETKKRNTFMEAFEKVKENFERIFADLSDGRGTLVLDNPMNISESGLMINASPGGKRLMSLDAMSGGEKVLTSSAFLLAIQQYKPAFFYIVDELDAALDHRNSIRLAQMLSASNSQFFMVTHNNNMLKYMDSAIGVSMVKGVSQIVGVRFNGEESPEGSAA